MNTQTYIVWMNEEYEQAEEAAQALLGQTIPVLPPGKTLEQAVCDYLTLAGHPACALAAVQPVTEYILNENTVEATPCRSVNCYNSVVFVEQALTAEQWQAIRKHPGLYEGMTADEARSVFLNVLPGSCDITHSQLDTLLSHYACDRQELDFILLPNQPDLAGFDDVSYLLRDVSWQEDGYKRHVDGLGEMDLKWLYARNATSINRWMAEAEVNLLDAAEVLYPHAGGTRLLAELVRQWVHHLMYRHTARQA